MNYLIQELTNVVNFIDNDTSKVLFSVGKTAIAKAQYVDRKYIQIFDGSGEVSGNLAYDNATSIQVQDFGGVATAWAGTFEQMLNKLNDEYFDNATTASGAATEAKQDTQIIEAQSANTKLDSLFTELQLKANLTDEQPIIISQKNLDAGGSFPVANKTILGSYVQDKNNLPFLLNRVSSGAATQTYSNGVVDMAVNSGEYAICQSYKRHLYLAGKSQNVELTFNNFGLQAGVTKRVGYYSSSTVAPHDTSLDGFFLESDGSNIKLCVYKNGVSMASVNRSAWDDPLDGTGASGVSIDFNNFTVAAFDFLYLGGTALRVKFNVGGIFYTAHTYKNSSINASTFIGSPVQPVRWEIRGVSASGALGQICAEVSTGGALDIVGYPLAIDTGNSFINANSTTDNYLICAIRLSDFKASCIDVFGATLGTTSDGYISRFILNPTFAVAPTWNALSTLGVEYAIGDLANPSTTTVTGGTVLSTSFVGQSTNQGLLTADSLFKIGASISGVADVLALTVQPTGSNLDIRGAINFKYL